MNMLKCDESFAETLAEIGKETYFDTFHAMNTRETMALYLEEAFDIDRIRQELNNPDSQFYLLLENEEPAAYFKINVPPAQTDINDPESVELERIYVRKKFQGRGLGKAMMQKTEEIARESGCTYIWLGVWERNEPAVAFYEHNGFYKFGKHFFQMGEERQQDHLLRKDLR